MKLYTSASPFTECLLYKDALLFEVSIKISSTGNPVSVIVSQYSSSKITVFVWGKKYAGFLSRAGNQLFLLAIQTNVTDILASEYRNKLVREMHNMSPF